MVVWGAVAVAAVAFPFSPRSRKFFRESKANVRIFGCPVIPLLGAQSIAVFGVAGYIALSSDAVGANTTSNLLVATGIFAVPLVYYVAVRWVRARQGIDLNVTFAELPPD